MYDITASIKTDKHSIKLGYHLNDARVSNCLTIYFGFMSPNRTCSHSSKPSSRNYTSRNYPRLTFCRYPTRLCQSNFLGSQVGASNRRSIRLKPLNMIGQSPVDLIIAENDIVQITLASVERRLMKLSRAYSAWKWKPD